MPFRGHHGRELPVAGDPLARHLALMAAFAVDVKFLGDQVPLSFVAASLVRCPGPAAEVARAVRANAERLGRIAPPMRLQIAAMLHAVRDDVDAFVAEFERVREHMRLLAIRGDDEHETAAILLQRIRNALRPISREQLLELRAVHAELMPRHWWRSGPEDLPACVVLLGRSDTPAQIGHRTRTIYATLREHARAWPGDALQTASNTLAVSGLSPDELAERFEWLVHELAEAGVRVRSDNYDEIATLCFVAQPTAKIVETIVAYQTTIAARLRWFESWIAFTLAVDLAFVRYLGDRHELELLFARKLLLDMHKVVAARQGAVRR